MKHDIRTQEPYSKINVESLYNELVYTRRVVEKIRQTNRQVLDGKMPVEDLRDTL